jgi:hypothetical protein
LAKTILRIRRYLMIDFNAKLLAVLGQAEAISPKSLGR